MPRLATSLNLFLALACLCSPLAEAKKKNETKKENSLENLLRPPRAYNMTMSPDGKYAASVVPVGDGTDQGIAIFDLNTLKIHRFFECSGRDIASLVWTTNEDVAIHMVKWDRYSDGLYSVNVNRKAIHPLLADDVNISWVDPIPESSSSWIWIRGGYQVTLGIAQLEVTGNATIRNHFGEYVTRETNSNPLVTNRIPNPPGQVFWWGTDQEHEPRLVLRFYEEKLEYLHRYNQKDDWAPIGLNAEHWDVQLFGAEKNILYVAGYNGEETKGLYTYNIDTNEIGELVYRDDYYDFSDSVNYLFFRDQVVGFRYQRDKPQFVWMLPELEGIQKMIDNVIKDRINIIYESSSDFSRHLVYSYSDQVPGSYSILDLKAKTLKEITQTAPWLNYDELATTEVFHFKTSDGLRLEGYLTKPVGKEGPFPTICLVHGGPWIRDTGGYDDETQLFVKHGYAVLRVNYRGSTGYGKTISRDYDYDFRKMQDDITEAVKFAIEEGIADPNRLAIMGASFGGYSALCGAAFEPDLYRCAITNMGVFDWEEMIKARKYQRSKYSHFKLLEQLGSPKDDEAAFEAISPIYHVDKIKIPIFVIHGKDDNNVSIRQSKKLKSELEKHNVEHEVLFVGREGHNIFDVKNRVKTYTQVLEFLEKHMR